MCEKRTSYWWRLWHLMRLFYSVNLDFWFRTRVRRWTWADIGPIRAWYCSHAQFHKDYAEWWSKGNDQLEHRPRRKYPRNLRHLAIGREISFLFKTKHLNHLNWRRKIICCEKSENLEILWAKTSRFHVFWKTLSQIAFSSFVCASLSGWSAVRDMIGKEGRFRSGDIWPFWNIWMATMKEICASPPDFVPWPDDWHLCPLSRMRRFPSDF